MIIFLTEQQINEKMLLKDYNQYIELVANAYNDAPEYEGDVVKHWEALKRSNYTLFKRLLSKIKVQFVTKKKSADEKVLNILGNKYIIKYIKGGQPYETQPQMKSEVQKTGVLKINIDNSDHPIFSIEDNIVMRTIHDYLTHILANVGFGGKGEIAAFNVHAKLAPKDAVPALFTEVVGQAAYAVYFKGFPIQKITLLKGFDYYNLGKVDDENYVIKDKRLVPISGEDKYASKEREDINFKAITN